MNKLKVMTILGTRPEIIKLSRVISELRKHTDHILVHTGQNYDYELYEVFFNEMGIEKPDYFLDAVGSTTAETIGNIIFKSDQIIEKTCPDAILLYGDTNSCLSVIAAKRRKVPVFHMEAGNRCFDQRVPEELNRTIVDHLSDINIPLTEHARQYLIQEGISPETIIKSGSCMAEVLAYHENKINTCNVLDKLGLLTNGYFLLSAHREENIECDEKFNNLLDMLNLICEHYNKPIIFSTHPRTMRRIKELPIGKLDKLVKILKPFGFIEYIKLQKEAFCVISDSGTITEEASLLGFPAITLRDAHERPEGMDEGTLIMTGIDPDRALQAIDIVTRQFSEYGPLNKVDDYCADNVSIKIVRIIQSYTDYINRTVWRK